MKELNQRYNASESDMAVEDHERQLLYLERAMASEPVRDIAGAVCRLTFVKEQIQKEYELQESDVLMRLLQNTIDGLDALTKSHDTQRHAG
ncbi:hypothetical protein OOZ53_11430 [Hoeflea sp. E7-10]|uniref:Uncharacterized protein n=1 Tax=Hoeflea poritis TaxID=2993659 RepID=A0ABT4VMY1_9HYPH|nr:hypothetical protein [Hoeflea poritis]